MRWQEWVITLNAKSDLRGYGSFNGRETCDARFARKWRSNGRHSNKLRVRNASNGWLPDSTRQSRHSRNRLLFPPRKGRLYDVGHPQLHIVAENVRLGNEIHWGWYGSRKGGDHVCQSPCCGALRQVLSWDRDGLFGNILLSIAG